MDGVGFALLVGLLAKLVPGLDVFGIHIGGTVREAGNDSCGEDLQLVRCILVAWADVGFFNDNLIC